MTWDVKTASEFMRRNLVTLTPQTGVVDGVARLLKHNISGAPVLDAAGNYLGVFSEKCSLNALQEAVERTGNAGDHVPIVREFMTTTLVALTPDVDVFDAIDQILQKQISGAPVVSDSGEFLGIFSEKTAMQVLVSAAYDQLPGTRVEAYMNGDPRRVIGEEDSLLDVAQKFQSTHYRRLPVLNDRRLAGQVSRRDVIRSEHRLANQLAKGDSGGATVESFVDREAKTVTPGQDLLSIAQIFLNSPYRRLPVVDSAKLLGQVSRRDLLAAAAELLKPKKTHRGAETLYLSPLSDSAPPSLS